MLNLVSKVEEVLPKLFNCERATLVLVHRHRKFLYQIKHEENSNSLGLVEHDINKGLAGYVAISTNTLFTDGASDDIRFFTELDDPNYSATDLEQTLARDVISVPVYTHHDR